MWHDFEIHERNAFIRVISVIRGSQK
jgi:hypothetical protein